MAKRATMISGLFCVAIAAIDGDWFGAVGFTFAMLWAREYFILKEREG